MILSAATVTWAAVAAAETLSGASTWLIVQLSVKTRSSGSAHLRRFSSVWGARSVLVAAVALWALCHVAARVATPLMCKLHVALSLGLFQPVFLAALLFLLNASQISDSSSSSSFAGFSSLLAASSLAFFLQVVVLFFLSEETATFLHLPDRLWRTSYPLRHVTTSPHSHVTCTCAHPLLSTAVFGSYAAGYTAAFLVSSAAAASAAINKSLRRRIRCLAGAVAVSLPVQVALLTVAGVWRPGHVAHEWADVAAFVAALGCAVVGEGVLVVKPISDSLAVMGRCCVVENEGV